jgi:hypothetical protein
MIIPISFQKINIGDTVINTREIKATYYTITLGHEFIVVEHDERYGRFICEDSSKLRFEFQNNDITKKIDFESAKKEYDFRQDTYKYTQEILGKCPHKDYGYSDYERYDTCKLFKKGCGDPCVPDFECAKFIKKEDMSKGLLKFLRKVKLEKLECLH